MAPLLNGIDHVHVEVSDRVAAERWYGEVLGLRRVERLMVWATEHGPLTLENADGTIHLALFEVAEPAGESTVAFGAGAEDFLAWKEHLEAHALPLRLVDHELAYSLYFHDPDGNMNEITTWDRDEVAAKLE
jgi:catechol-2,3-dioxygenase